MEYNIRDFPGMDVPTGKFTTNFSCDNYQFAVWVYFYRLFFLFYCNGAVKADILLDDKI